MVGVPAALHCCSHFHHTPPISSHKRHHGSNQQHSVNMCPLADLAPKFLLWSLSITRKHLSEISCFVPQLGCPQPAIAVEPAKGCCLSAESKRWTCISRFMYGTHTSPITRIGRGPWLVIHTRLNSRYKKRCFLFSKQASANYDACQIVWANMLSHSHRVCQDLTVHCMVTCYAARSVHTM